VPTDAALPWLLVVARNVISDQHRRGRRQDALAAEIANAAAGLSEPGPDAAVVERITVLTALAQLSISDREVLFLTVWDGLSNGDAATVAGCSAATFAVRLHRARRRLADALQQFDSGSSRFAREVPHSRGAASRGPQHPRDHRPLTTSKEDR
ncbi:MAG: ECF-type sigma factor, partial [Actinomycetia bacterium]|nr:ECF-type sigma factor [Actinomycetes bacterium]